MSLLLSAPNKHRCKYYLPWCSSETVNFLRPCARREANTRRPFLVAILSRKPCLFTRRRLWGWNVLFIMIIFYLLLFLCVAMPIYPTVMVAAETIGTFLGCKSTHIFLNNKEISEFSVIISLFLIICSLHANVMALNAMQHDGCWR